MRIEPRQQLLEVWRAVARVAVDRGEWNWRETPGRNSISDAEQLLCVLGPATEIPSFGLDQPDETADDVLASLAGLGNSVEIPRLLIRALTAYFTAYTDKKDGVETPVFAGGDYFVPAEGVEPPQEARSLPVVDSYAVSVRLALATIGFVKVFRSVVSRPQLRAEIDALEVMASRRLTAAMVGLLRSFAVHVFEPHSPEGTILLGMVNQSGLPRREVLDQLHNELRRIKAGLRDLSLGSGQVSDIDEGAKLFECGWSWGVVGAAPPVRTVADVGEQRPGVALSAPYLYFTVVALDCIRDLFSERTRLLGLLDEEQQRLARALQLRWDLTQSYWSRIARFGGDRWPLGDVPWRTVDGVENEYLSLLVTSIVVQDLTTRQAPDREVHRVVGVLDELAARARITRRAVAGDTAVLLHHPGFALRLEFEEDGKARDSGLRWRLADFSPQLLKQAIRVAGLLRDGDRRGDVVALADQAWEHLQGRRLPIDATHHLWDRPPAAADVPGPAAGPSWYYTERVVQCLVAAAELVASAPLRSPQLAAYADDLLAEADHIFDQELLNVSAEAAPALGTVLQHARATLRRAHQLIRERPGTAAVLAGEVLRELDRLAAARSQAPGAG